MEQKTRLANQVTFRITAEEATRLAALVEKEERKLADVARRIFRKGLKAAERAK